MSPVTNPDGTPILEKYERNGWPSITRPDVKPPTGPKQRAAYLSRQAEREALGVDSVFGQFIVQPLAG